jgi:3-oxoadipate enol-lactonase
MPDAEVQNRQKPVQNVQDRIVVLSYKMVLSYPEKSTTRAHNRSPEYCLNVEIIMTAIQKIQVKSGTTLGYVDVGQGTPVILIHGLFLDHTAFEHQLKTLIHQVRIIAIDIHGHGASSVVDRPITLDEMAEDYYDLVQQLGIQQAIWGGVSMGGMTSLRTALKHPEAVLGLLLLNTNADRGAGKKVPGVEGLNAPLTMRFLWGTKFLKNKTLEAGLFGKTTLATKPELQRIWVDRMEPIKGISMKYCVEAVLSADSILDQLSAIAVPTIVAGGIEDVALPMAASREIHDRIKDSSLVEIEQCGHSSSIEQPEKVSQLLEELLQSIEHS